MKKNICLKRNEEDRKPQLPTLSEENFKIFLRVKPSNNTHQSNKDILKILTKNKIQIQSPYYTNTETSKQYSYEEVFNQTANNSEVFSSTMIKPITNALSGYNSTVFIYGMTGAGKTYTMFGNIGNTTSKGINKQQEGLVSMTIDYLFKQIQNNPQVKTQVFVSFYEIYNQSIRDLLQDRNKPHQIMEDPIQGFVVQDLMQISLEDTSHTKQTIISGIERRSMNSTKSNQVSSRSHAILQFNIKRFINTNDGQSTVLQSKFFMIDLAGNQKTSNNQSQRFIEGVNINKSLLTLGKCLKLLSAEKKNTYIPFRQSKLTRILKQSLGGNSKTVMIACVSSQRRFYEETLNTLKYSSIARKIKNKGIKHNIKILHHHLPENDFPIHSHPKMHTQTQEKFKQVLSQIISAIEQKSKIERILQSLQESRSENEELIQHNSSMYQTCASYIQQIDNTTEKMMKTYDFNMQKAQNAYQKLMRMITEHKASKFTDNKQKQSNQIYHLKQIIAEQQRVIQQLQNKVDHNDITIDNACQIVQPNQISTDIKIQDYNLSMPATRKQKAKMNYNLIKRSQSECSMHKNNSKKLTINQHQIGTPKSSYHNQSRQILGPIICNSSKNKDLISQQKLNKYGHKQITISLNAEQQPSSVPKNKEFFIKRLKQSEKKARVMNSSTISSLIDEQETYKYDLNNSEMSMLRKLKFFHRQNRIRQKSKSPSIGANRPSSTSHFRRI